MKNNKFEEYFKGIYLDRWDALKNALISSQSQVIRPIGKSIKSKDSLESAFNLPLYSKELYESVNELNSDGIRSAYVMDSASILAAMALDVGPDDFVLDMCAAPGGKTIILLEALESGELWANEISRNRREKLKEVIRLHVPANKRERVFIKGKDGNRFGLISPNTFDKILVDAPCSGEKHLLLKESELEKWGPKRTKRLATNQYSLLCSALLALKPGGTIVYSTCSISPLENDAVIKKLLLKKGESAQLVEIKGIPNEVEKTEFGYQILPDKSGHGPIYFSKIQKK